MFGIGYDKIVLTAFVLIPGRALNTFEKPSVFVDSPNLFDVQLGFLRKGRSIRLPPEVSPDSPSTLEMKKYPERTIVCDEVIPPTRGRVVHTESVVKVFCTEFHPKKCEPGWYYEADDKTAR